MDTTHDNNPHDLDRTLNQMTMPTPDLFPHQELVKDFIVDHAHCGVYLGMGGGKTLSTLMALSEIRPNGHILVVAPLAIARSTWIGEIEEWGFPLRTKSLLVNDNDKKLTKKKRLERYEEIFTDPPTMYFINVDLIADLVNNMPIGVDPVTKKKYIQWPFPTVILDESQNFKSGSSTRFKALRKVRPAILRMIQLSGTPTPQGVIDLWGQIYLLDEGYALRNTMGGYLEKWFRPTLHVQNRPVRWEPLPGAEEDIYKRVQKLVMSTETTDMDIPAVSIDVASVSLPKDAMGAYKAFERDLVLELAHPDPNDPRTLIITADSAAILRNKLIQFASGTIYTGADHDNDFMVVHNEKMEMTDYLIRNNGGSPVLIAYRYRSERQRLLTELTQAGHQVEAFDGSRSMVDRWNAQQIPVMVIHPASAGHGLNLQQGGHTLIWHTLPDSLQEYLQTNARLPRPGQLNPVQIWMLVTKGTRDATQPRRLLNKETTQQEFIDSVHREAIEYIQSMEDIIGDLDINPL